MANEIKKTVKLDVQVEGESRLKRLQADLRKTLNDLDKAREKLNGAAQDETKKLNTKIKLLQKEADLRRQLVSDQRVYLNDLNKQLQKHREALALEQERSRSEAMRSAQSAGSRKFWSQDVWQGNVISNVYRRYGLRGQLLRGYSASEEQAARIGQERRALSERLEENRAEIAGTMFKLRRGATVAERSDAAVALARLKRERADLGGMLKDVSGKEAASLAAAKTSATAIGVMNVATKAAKAVANSFVDAFRTVSGISLSIKDNFRDILSRVTQMTSKTGVASYASGTTLFTNAAARQLQLRYGLTGGQAYAFGKARGALNIQSDEDLLYMNARQRQTMIQLMQKQEQWYAKLESSGTLENIQQMQLDFDMFKEEMAVDFLQWIGENKDLILTVAKGTLNVLKLLVQALGKPMTFFGIDYSGSSYGAGSTALSDAVSSGTGSVYNKNVKMTSTFNAEGVLSDQRELEQWFENRMTQEYRKVAEGNAY